LALVWAAEDERPVGGLGAQLRRMAQRRGCAGRWRFFASGALGVRVAAVDALAAEPAAATPEECAAAAARHGVDGWLLQLVLGVVGEPAGV
jgi:hypothetical protein